MLDSGDLGTDDGKEKSRFCNGDGVEPENEKDSRDKALKGGKGPSDQNSCQKDLRFHKGNSRRWTPTAIVLVLLSYCSYHIK